MTSLRCMKKRTFMILFVFVIVIADWLSGTCFAQNPAQFVKAYYFKSMPAEYAKQELLIASLKDTGANTIILELPLNEEGVPDLRRIPNSVYLAHQAGLKFHIVLPMRRLPGVLSQHSGWEDTQYDLGSGTVQSTGKLDLFNNDAVAYLASLAKEIASFSVDALLLDRDFFYAPVEGIGPAAREKTLIELNWAPDPRQLFKKVVKGPNGIVIEEYGEYFKKWTALKRDRLLNVFDQIKTAGRSVNSGIKIGISVPVVLPVSTAGMLFTQFAYDISAFQKYSCDYYWTAIEYRDIRADENLTYGQMMEQLSRMALSAITAVGSREQVILALQATTKSGKMVPLFQMEEVANLVRNSGETGIAFIIGPDVVVNRTLMKKIFRNQAQP